MENNKQVYSFGDCDKDYVIARSEEEAVTFYEKQTGLTVEDYSEVVAMDMSKSSQFYDEETNKNYWSSWNDYISDVPESNIPGIIASNYA